MNLTNQQTKYHILGITKTGPFLGIEMTYQFDGSQDSILFLLLSFGVNKNDQKGLLKYKATKVPDLFFIKNESKALLLVNCRYPYKNIDLNSRGLDKLILGEGQKVAVMWNSDSFGIFVEGEEDMEWLKELHQAILEIDVEIGYSSDSSLIINIYSKSNLPIS